MQISFLPILIVELTIIGLALAIYLYYIHFVRGVRVREVGGSHLCPRCGRALVDLTPSCPECNKKLVFSEKRP